MSCMVLLLSSDNLGHFVNAAADFSASNGLFTRCIGDQFRRIAHIHHMTYGSVDLIHHGTAALHQMQALLHTETAPDDLLCNSEIIVLISLVL